MTRRRVADTIFTLRRRDDASEEGSEKGHQEGAQEGGEEGSREEEIRCRVQGESRREALHPASQGGSDRRRSYYRGVPQAPGQAQAGRSEGAHRGEKEARSHGQVGRRWRRLLL